MLIRNVNQTPHEPVQMEGVKDAQIAMMVGGEDGAPNFAMRHIRVASDGFTPRHQHDYEHEVYVVKGQGTVLLEGEEHPIKEGDVILVPANMEHQFKAVSGDVSEEGLTFLCMVPRQSDCGKDVPGS